MMKKTLNPTPPIHEVHEPLPLINEHKKQIKKIVITPKDISNKVDKKNLAFDSESEKNAFKNHLIIDETISKFIESSFNGNILYLGPLDEERAEEHWDT